MSKDEVCVARICIKNFKFGEVNNTDGSFDNMNYDGILGLNEPTSVKHVFCLVLNVCLVVPNDDCPEKIC